jgi:hypothetical protein
MAVELHLPAPNFSWSSGLRIEEFIARFAFKPDTGVKRDLAS